MDEVTRVGASMGTRVIEGTEVATSATGSCWWVGSLVAALLLTGVGCFPELPPEVDGDTFHAEDTGATDALTADALESVDALEDTQVVEDTRVVDDTRVVEDSHGADADTTSLPLSPPGGVAASDDRAGDVEVRWDAVVGAAGYHVERCDGEACGSSGAWARLTDAAVAATRYEDAEVDAPAGPGAPGGFAATGDRPHDVVLTWSSVVAPRRRATATG